MSLDAKSQEMLDAIRQLPKEELSKDQLAFLMARRSYLTSAELEHYADLIEAHESGSAGDGLDAMKLADLKKLAEEEDIDLGDASKKPEVIAAIREARENA